MTLLGFNPFPVHLPLPRSPRKKTCFLMTGELVFSCRFFPHLNRRRRKVSFLPLFARTCFFFSSPKEQLFSLFSLVLYYEASPLIRPERLKSRTPFFLVPFIRTNCRCCVVPFLPVSLRVNAVSSTGTISSASFVRFL